MGRPAVRRIEPHRASRSRDGTMVAGIAVVVLFALIGLVSAGIFVAGKVSGNSHPAASNRSSSSATLAARDVARARAQATAIVAAAQSASQSIVRSATRSARRRASGIVSAANKRASTIVRSAQAVPPTQPAIQPTAPAATSVGTTGATGNTATSAAGTTGTTGTSGVTGTTGTTGSALGATSPSTPNLSGLPASWLVVAYSPTFGSGPGTAGSITVVNRGKITFSGAARVKYATGGSATAFFTGLAPGQSAVLPLNGRAYAGGGYTILVRHVH